MTLNFLLSCIFFYLPGAVANMGTIFGKHVPFFKNFKQPIDNGYKLNNIRLIGEHKQYCGFLFGVFSGVIFGIFKTVFLDLVFFDFLIIKTNIIQGILLYSIISLGAVCGDLIKSVIKRQLKIVSHKAWIPFDEIDHSTTSLLLAKLFFPIPWNVILTIIIIYFFLHVLANVVGYKMKIRKVPS